MPILSPGRPDHYAIEYSISGNPSWSPDGNFLAVSTNMYGIQPSGMFENSNMNRSIVTWDLQVDRVYTTTNAVDVSSQLLKAVKDMAPAWSPQGENLAFIRCYATGTVCINNTGTLMLKNLQDGSYRTLTENVYARVSDPSSVNMLVWSPNGEWIAYHLDKGKKYYSIGLVNVTTGELRDLLEENILAGKTPAWSPDGRQIVFSSPYEGNDEIYRIDATGENLLNLTQNSASDLWPQWLPDGKTVVFLSNRDTESGYRLYQVGQNGVAFNLSTAHLAEAFTWVFIDSH